MLYARGLSQPDEKHKQLLLSHSSLGEKHRAGQRYSDFTIPVGAALPGPETSNFTPGRIRWLEETDIAAGTRRQRAQGRGYIHAGSHRRRGRKADAVGLVQKAGVQSAQRQ